MDMINKLVDTPAGVGLCRIIINGQAIVYYLDKPFFAYDVGDIKLCDMQDEMLYAQIEAKAIEELSK